MLRLFLIVLTCGCVVAAGRATILQHPAELAIALALALVFGYFAREAR